MKLNNLFLTVIFYSLVACSGAKSVDDGASSVGAGTMAETGGVGGVPAADGTGEGSTDNCGPNSCDTCGEGCEPNDRCAASEWICECVCDGPGGMGGTGGPVAMADESMVESTVFITELLLSNDTGLIDEAGEADDWLELHNEGSEAVDLTGWSMGDDIEAGEAPWLFAEGTTLDAGAYLVIWADKDEEQGPLHASFKLSSDGETITLLTPTGDVADEVIVPAVETDSSYARDGTSDVWNITNMPTPGAANQ